MDSPQQAPAGWYHDGGGWLRWWDGTGWTEHRAAPAVAAQPRPRGRGSARYVAGWVLLALSGLGLFICVLGLMGDTFPTSRAGVGTEADGFAVVNAVCSGERLRDVTLWRRTDEGPWVVLWRISGDAPLPDRLAFGAVPIGMQTVSALDGEPGANEPLALQVVTSELDSTPDMEFTLSEVPAEGVLVSDHVYPTTEKFERAMFADTHCGDPYGEEGKSRFVAIAFSLTAALGAVGVVLLVLATRRPSPSRRT